MNPVSVTLAHASDFMTWRSSARECIARQIRPEQISWRIQGDQVDLFDAGVSLNAYLATSDGLAKARSGFTVPAAFIRLAEQVICHSDAQRFALLYRVLWRLTHEEPDLMARYTDDDMHRLRQMATSVRRDQHKMKAFVRFRQYQVQDEDYYHAFFQPDHHVLRSTAGFFCRRFSNMQWSISTADECAHWDGHKLQYGPAVVSPSLADAHDMETLWLTYFQSIFNPARLKLAAMRSEMPVKYWKHLPESRLISELSRDAGHRSQRMIEKGPTAPSRYSTAASLSIAKSNDIPRAE